MFSVLYVLPSINFVVAELQSIWQINWLHQQGYSVHLLVLNHIVCTPQALLIPAHCITQLHYPDSTITKSAIIYSYKLIVPISIHVTVRSLVTRKWMTCILQRWDVPQNMPVHVVTGRSPLILDNASITHPVQHR